VLTLLAAGSIAARAAIRGILSEALGRGLRAGFQRFARLRLRARPADAIRRAGSPDRAKIRDALATTKDFQAVTGVITINEHRDASKKAVIITVKDGRFEFVQSIDP
jgi:hypothetical protein